MSRLCQPPDPVFEVAQGSVLGFAGFSGSVPNAAINCALPQKPEPLIAGEAASSSTWGRAEWR